MSTGRADHGLGHRRSGTVTGWRLPLQSGILLFSILVLVQRAVAPIRLSSPRAIIGLKQRWPRPARLRHRRAGTDDGALVDENSDISSPWCSVHFLQHLLHALPRTRRDLVAPATEALKNEFHRRPSRKVSGTSPITSAAPAFRQWRSCHTRLADQPGIQRRRGQHLDGFNLPRGRSPGRCLPSRAILVRSHELRRVIPGRTASQRQTSGALARPPC